MPRVIVVEGQDCRILPVDEGSSLVDFVRWQYPETGNFPVPVIAFYGGAPVLRKDWAKVALEGEAVAVFVRLPQKGGGGGSNAVALALTIAVTVVAAATGNYLAASEGLISAIGATGAKIVGGVVSGAILAGGSMLIGALSNTPAIPSGQLTASSAEAASPTYSINANANQIRMYQPELEVFGRILITPDHVVQPYSRYENNDMYLYQVFGQGRGRSETEEMFFGSTAFWRNGHLIADSAYVSDTDNLERDFNLLLPTAAEGGSWTAALSAAALTTEVRNLTLRFFLPEGCCSYSFTDAHFDSAGKEWLRGAFSPIEHSVSGSVQIRELDASGTAPGVWRHFADFSRSFADESAQTFTVSGPDPGYGRYQLRVINSSAHIGTVTAMETQQPAWNQNRPPIAREIEAREKLVLAAISSMAASIQVELVEPGQPVTLFPDNVETSESVSGQELFAPNSDSFAVIGPFPVCPPGTTTDKIINDIVLGKGLGRWTASGSGTSLANYSVTLRFDYQLIDDNGNALSEWAALREETLTMATQTPQRRTYESSVPEGRYQVKAQRVSNGTGDGQTLDQVSWSALRSVLPGTLTYRQQVVALRIKATNVLSQAASERFRVLQTRKLPLYDRATGSWSEERPTRSFAAAVCSICKCDWGGRIGDELIDLDGLWRLDEIVTEKGWSFDAAIDGAYSVWGLLLEVCKALRVVPRPIGPKLTFLMDGPGRPVRHSFTPHDIMRGSFRLNVNTFTDSTPDMVTCAYMDQDAGFQRRDVRAKRDDSESREPARRTPLGIVRRKQAYDFAWHEVQCNRWRRIEVEFQTESVSRNLNVGDVCSISHPRFRSLASGTLKDWNPATLALYLAESPEKPEGDIYLSLNRPDGSPWGPVKLAALEGDRARMDPADYALLLTQGHESPFDWLTRGHDRMPSVWTLQEGRDFGGRFLIRKITPVDMYRYALTLMNDAPQVYSDVQPPMPAWEYRGNTQSQTALDAPASLRVTLAGQGEGRALAADWLPVNGASAYLVEYSTDGGNYSSLGRANINRLTFDAPLGPLWLRVAAVNDFMQGSWSLWSGNSAVTRPDAPLLSLAEPFDGGSLSLAWPPVPGAQSYTLRVFARADALTPARVLQSTALSFIYTPEMAHIDGGPWRDLRADIAATNAAGSSERSPVLAVSDPAPEQISLADISAVPGTHSVTFSLAAPSEAASGYIIARGLYANFEYAEVQEVLRVGSLPYTWGGLSPDREYYFRLAATDAFYDATLDLGSLNYSESVNLRTEEA